jgi:hypothetical protein
MTLAMYPALFFTVAMLITNAYFLLGGIPLLVLQHDTPMDARFVRGFFDVYCKAAITSASGACASYALWERFSFALGAAGLLGVALLLRRRLLPAMQRLGTQIQHAGEAAGRSAIARFRRMHVAALTINLMQLALVVWGTVQLSL